MFGESQVVAKYKAEVERLNAKLEKQVEESKEAVAKLTEKHKSEVESLTIKHKDEVERSSNKHKDEVERVVQGQDVAIQKAVTKITDDNTALKISAATLKDKVAMYETAFKNLGFDVKDMKDILNKLVDGVIAKGTINVIK